MPPLPNHKSSVAVDLGAQSCRVSLLRWIDGAPQITVVHRFPNAPLESHGALRWDIAKIVAGVESGLRACASQAPEGIASIAIDGWAVDYVRLDQDGQPVENPFCYRDQRTEAAESAVHSIIPPSKLYSLTGIQLLRINTLYQLYADKLAGADVRSPWLLIPEYITHRLGGRRVAEYTNATHTSLVRLGAHQWCAELFQDLGLDPLAAPEIVPSGTIVGKVHGQLAELPQLRDTQLIVGATHDTAAAIAAIPAAYAAAHDWAFISSGTWSLVGTVLDAPCVNNAARDQNFTNLGGAAGKICFLKNVNGMWLLRQCMDEWQRAGHTTSLQQLIHACAALPSPKQLVNVDEPELMLPGNTIHKINAQLQHAGIPPFSATDTSAIPKITNLIFHSLAARYAEVLSSIQQVTGKQLRRLFIVGGGSQNHFLNRLTAARTGLQVLLGSVESTTIGNFAIQLAALENAQSGNAATGVSAQSIARFAQELAVSPFTLSTSRETN
ncbi:MAG TPA: FGGY-family carbohydrate kinase [Candidatus Acidoferrum sp.]|nr:FGGY-family carbohydrate kinase [Candidatus Acidoferrum sp.]